MRYGFFKEFGEKRKIFPSNRETRGHCVAAEAFDEIRSPFAYVIECVAQMHAFDRAAGALQKSVFVVGRKSDDRAIDLFLDAACDKPHDALMPVRFKKSNGGAMLPVHVADERIGIELHGAFELAALAVERIEFERKRLRFVKAFGEQTLNADAHLGQTPGRVDARRNAEGEVARRGGRRIASCDCKERIDARTGKASANAV